MNDWEAVDLGGAGPGRTGTFLLDKRVGGCGVGYC
jgi:hypothetical protein